MKTHNDPIRLSYGPPVYGTAGDDLMIGTSGSDNLIGLGGSDELRGGAGDDLLEGYSGNDYLFGHDGNDELYGDDGNDQLYGNAGNDIVVGGAGQDFLSGGDGNDILDGGSGDDEMQGGFGDDTYYVDSPEDVVIDMANGGHDTLVVDMGFTVTVTMGDPNIEDVVLIGDGSIIGNDNDNYLEVTGNATTIDGGAGNDVLITGSAADMIGGTGNDTYHVFNAGADVIEYGGGGDDIVYTRVNFDMNGSSIERATIVSAAGVAPITVIGNAGHNVITGSAFNDIIDGRAGIDTMNGGAGNDVYYVDTTSDVIVEVAGGGTDKVFSSVSYNLSGTFLENAELTGTADLGLTGSDADNVLTGNSGANIINGGLGADTMAGGLGDDVYYVDNTGDVVVEASGLNTGVDHVYTTATYTLGANVENATVTGSNSRNLIGNGIDNILVGSSGNNVLVGGGGVDRLTGGAGADRFDFNAVSESTFSAYDRIMDLENQDYIDLSTIDANTGVAGDQAFSLVSAFTGTAGQITLTYNAASAFTILAADVNGDAVADMRVILYGDHSGYTNFIL